MTFFRFVRACRKYNFTFALSTYLELKLIIRPYHTYKNIEIVEEYPNYNRLFKRAIKEMKEYRKINRS